MSASEMVDRVNACNQMALLLGLLLALLGGWTPECPAQTASPAPTDRKTYESDPSIQNLRAFAKLYGYVRYFHPSDAAADTDWERLAIHGVRHVQDASTRTELRTRLDSLFSPIAPTMALYNSDEPPPAPADQLTPQDTTGLNLVAWQHQGLGLGNRGPYRSIRLHRKTKTSNRSRFGTVTRRVDATPHRGKQMRLRAAVKVEESERAGRAQLWLRVDRADDKRGFFDNMSDRPITTASWDTYQITGSVAEDAKHIVLGGFLLGSGTARFDAFQLQVRDSAGTEWTNVSLKNAGFETGQAEDSPAEWDSGGEGYTFKTKAQDVYDGRRSLTIKSETTTRMADPLFESRPAPGKVVNKPLGRGLSAQIPLALYSRDEQTLRPAGAPAPDRQQSTLDSIELSSLSAKDPALRLADVIITWNVVQHFYPYLDVVDANWDQTLTRSLQRAEADTSSRQFLRTLRRMMVPMKDGHANVSHPSDSLTAGLPLRFDRIEERVIVADTISYDESENCARPGDVLTALNDTPAEAVLRRAKRALSGSPQWKTLQALLHLGEGPPGSTAQLELHRQGRDIECQVPRATDGTNQKWQQQLHFEPRPAPIDTLSNDVRYVDLTRVENQDLRPLLDTLAQVESVIFDVRGYPVGGSRELLRHLSPDTLRSAHFEVPQIIYPDQQDAVGYTDGRWTLPPKKPQLTSQIAFLTDARAISFAESIMGIVEHYDLGMIVGQPTAGTNGNVNPLELPGGYQVYWTGMRVRKHDGSQHHLIGIQPDIEAERTIEGMRNGRDEVLQKGLEVVRDSIGTPRE